MQSLAGAARPTVFISSTIYDFADLRDALRFWLEEMGFDVRLSEQTDFPHRPEAGTLDACFEAIRTSDFYVLLIGLRRGAWYDESAGVSVTRQEYRVAYESFRSSGAPRLLLAVRSDVLVALRERAKLRIQAGPSQLEDPEFTAALVKEVRREEEVDEASRGAGVFPSGNWLASFRDFRELIAMLRETLRITGPLPRAALLEAVRRECEHNLRVLLSNHQGSPFWQLWWLSKERKEIELTEEHFQGLGGSVSVTFEQMKHVIGFLVGCLPPADRFYRTTIDQAVNSGALLEYDRSENRLVSTPLLEAIYRLREEFDWYVRRTPLQEAQQRVLLGSWERSRTWRGNVQVDSFALLALFAAHDTLQNIARLSIAILRYLYGHTKTVDVQLQPSSPVARFAQEIDKEAVSQEQLVEWLKADDFALRFGVWEETETERRQREATEQRLRESLGEEVYENLKSEIGEILTTELENLRRRVKSQE